MPEAPLFIKPTLTECKALFFAEQWEDLERSFSSLIVYLLYTINCNCQKCCWKCALCFWATMCLCSMSSDRENINMFIYIYVRQRRRGWILCVSLSFRLSLILSRHQTMVQMVLRLGSKRTTFPSAAFVFVLYMGFSKVACPLLFSWTEHPVYCALSVFLGKEREVAY